MSARIRMNARRLFARAPALHVLVPLAFLGAVVWWALRQPRVALPHSAPGVSEAILGLAVYALAMLGRAERWHRILRLGGVQAHRGDTYSLTAVGYMGNNILPARSGELLRTFLLAGRTEASKRTVLGTILAERALDAVALGLILVVVAYDLLRRIGVPGGGRVGLVVGALVVVAAAVAFALRGHPFVARAMEFLRPLAGPVRALLSAEGARLLLASVVIWTLESAVYLLVGFAVGVHVGLLGAMSVVAVANLFSLVPAAPGYVGTFDAAVLFSVKAVGAGASAALSYLLLLRFVLFIPISVVGLVLLGTRYGGLSRLRTARAEARAEAV
jgi:glycosyltransferase 2 family protein